MSEFSRLTRTLRNEVIIPGEYTGVMTEPSLMGIYTYENSFESNKTKISPQIKGINKAITKYVLLVDNYDSVAYSHKCELINEAETEIVGDKIVINKTMLGKGDIALIVDKSTLDPTAKEPVKSGTEWIFLKPDAKDKNGKALDVPFGIRFVRGEIDSRLAEKFDKLDGKYYDLIKAKDGSVNKSDLVLIEKMDIEFREGLPSFLKLNFSYNDFNKESKVFVFHYGMAMDDDGNPIFGEDGPTYEWELVTSKVGTGLVAAEFGSFSPVVIYADKITSGELEGVTTPGATTPESPVTGDGATGYALLIGLMALMGMVILGKKEYNK